jgi:hypothetical protein
MEHQRNQFGLSVEGLVYLPDHEKEDEDGEKEQDVVLESEPDLLFRRCCLDLDDLVPLPQLHQDISYDKGKGEDENES